MTEAPIAELEAVKSGSDNGQTILVVDDDESQVVALEYRLRQQGFRVQTAHNGSRAIELAREEKPDLILLDLRLPDIEGFDVCAELADSSNACCIPVIILSGMERPDIVRRSRSAGCEYYVRKPYDPNVLLTLINNALDRDTDLDW